MPLEHWIEIPTHPNHIHNIDDVDIQNTQKAHAGYSSEYNPDARSISPKSPTPHYLRRRRPSRGSAAHNYGLSTPGCAQRAKSMTQMRSTGPFHAPMPDPHVQRPMLSRRRGPQRVVFGPET